MRCAPAATVSAGLAFARRWRTETRRKWSSGGLPHCVTFVKLVLPIRSQCYDWHFTRVVPPIAVEKGPAASVCGGAVPSAACMPDSAADEHDRRHGPRPGSVPPSPPPPPVIQTGADAKRPARRGALAGSRTEQTNGLSSVYHPMSVTATMFGNSRGNICASPEGHAAPRKKPGQTAKTGGLRVVGVKLSGQPIALVERRKKLLQNIPAILTF